MLEEEVLQYDFNNDSALRVFRALLEYHNGTRVPYGTMVRTTRVLKSSPARERNRSRLPAPQNTGSFTAMHGTMVLSETPRCDVFSPFFDYSCRDRLVHVYHGTRVRVAIHVYVHVYLVAPGNFGENRHFGEKRHANGGYWFHMAYELREYWFRWL